MSWPVSARALWKRILGEDEESPQPVEPVVVEERKEQTNSKREVSRNMYDGADDDGDRVGVRQKSNSEQSDKQQLPIVVNEDSDRFNFKEEKEKRQKADLLYKKNMVQLGKKGSQSIKAVEMNPKVENTIKTQVMALETVRRNEVVEERNYTQRQLSQEQNASISQDGILTKHLCKPKEIERAHKKVKSEAAVVRQLQGELADTQRKLSMTEALLKAESHHRMCSQYKIQELQKELDESRNQAQHEKEALKKHMDLFLSQQQNLHEVMKQKRYLEKEITRLQKPLNMPKRNLSEQLSFPKILKPSIKEMESETTGLKQKKQQAED
ncbi:ankyrin repeat domain-containing protein 26-like isoform X1 [Myotis yumanensis]|uniref:ankyrin repeat domain-containing protein 26-like isoform X1 n=1 Tax=Myotis yumanensis TaxID=159337 RepID=UPI0038D22F66